MRHLRLIDPVGEADFRPAKESFAMLMKILSRENASLYWRHLPAAFAIASKRFALNSLGFRRVMAEYFALCGQYTHFIAQVGVVKKSIASKRYQPWQKYSWNELLQSPVDRVERLEAGKTATMFDRVKVHLQINHDIHVTRLEALGYFVEPYLQQGLQGLMEQQSRPDKQQFIELEIQAYRQACRQVPEIVVGVDFAELEKQLRENFAADKEYLVRMRRLLRKSRAVAESG